MERILVRKPDGVASSANVFSKPDTECSSDDDSDSDEELGRMIYNCSQTAKARAAAEAANNTPSSSSGHDEQQKKKKVYRKKCYRKKKICSNEECTNVFCIKERLAVAKAAKSVPAIIHIPAGAKSRRAAEEAANNTPSPSDSKNTTNVFPKPSSNVLNQSEDQIGDMIYNNSGTAKARAAEAVANNKPAPYDSVTSTNVSSNKRRSDSVHDEQKEKKRVYDINICSSDGSTNIAQKVGVCYRHGDVYYRHRANEFRKTCSHEGCTSQAKRGGVCIRHGAPRNTKLCKQEGCTNIVIRGGVCWGHGAKDTAKRCNHEGCTNHVIRGGVCCRHGAIKHGATPQHAQEVKKMANADVKKCKGCGAKSEEQFTPSQWTKRFGLTCISCQSKAFKDWLILQS